MDATGTIRQHIQHLASLSAQAYGAFWLEPRREHVQRAAHPLRNISRRALHEGLHHGALHQAVTLFMSDGDDQHAAENIVELYTFLNREKLGVQAEHIPTSSYHFPGNAVSLTYKNNPFATFSVMNGRPSNLRIHHDSIFVEELKDQL